MQNLWAKVLAGEANSPGHYTKRTVNYLSSLDKYDAELFAKLCGFSWFSGHCLPLIYDIDAKIYHDEGITFTALQHLDDVGLICFQSVTGFSAKKLQRRIVFNYYGSPVEIAFSKDQENELILGHVILSKVGRELAPICGSKPVDGFFDHVLKKWFDCGLTLSSPCPLLATEIEATEKKAKLASRLNSASSVCTAVDAPNGQHISG